MHYNIKIVALRKNKKNIDLKMNHNMKLRTK